MSGPVRRRSRRGLGLGLALALGAPSAALAYPPQGGAKTPPPADADRPPGADGASPKGPPPAPATQVPQPPVPEEDRFGRPGEPGSGVPLDEARPPDPGRLGAPLPRRPRSPEEAAALDEIEALYHRYEEASAATEDSLRYLLVIEAETSKAQLEQAYEREIRTREAKVRSLRAKAIERYEDFLKLHPDDPAWTPEIMFRLAELHFESSSDRHRRQEDAWEKELAAWEEAQAEKPDPNASPPPAPLVDYKEAVTLYRATVERFPRYVYNDVALYMMGILLLEQEDYDASRQALLALVCSNRFQAPLEDGSNVVSASSFAPGDYDACEPRKADSKFLAESWLRVGELHYDVDELDPALAAYRQAAADPENDLYDEALIRMAWTLYLKREFAQAVTRLDEFVRFADAVEGTERGEGAAEFRDEAVKYIAKSYLEDDWDLDGRTDKVRGMARLDRDYAQRGDEPHVPEIYTALGGLLADQTDFREAIAIWETTLQRYPTTRTAPEIQFRIMQAHEYLQDKEGATAARDKLATNYLRGTPWFYANEGDSDALDRAFALAEDALVATAVDHHARAQQLRAQGEDERAKQEYMIAARAYQAYLERFPDTPSSYEYRYEYAESLYYSDQWLEAAGVYAEVRDSNLDNRLQKDAAEGAIYAYRAEIDAQQQAGQLTIPDMPKDGDPGPFDALEMPELVAELQLAIDRFVELFPDTEDTATLRYEAASYSQRHNRFDEAEVRFVGILEDHCAENVAINAGYAIIDAHVVRQDLAGTREWTDKLAGMGCGAGEEATKFAGELKTIGNAVRFQEASLLLEAGEYEAAADRYVALVDQAPDDPNADRALNNAAVAYEKIGRFSSASKTYERIYTKYPDSEFADDALLRTGYNHARFFEFEEAVGKYLILAEADNYADSEYRLVALKNAAGLMENLQDYARASALWVEWSNKSESTDDKAEGMFAAARVTGKTGDHRKTIKAYQAYLKAYGSQPSEAEHAAEAWLRIGQSHAALGKRKDAESAYRSCIQTFNDRGLAPGTEAAVYPAEAQFLLAEYTLSDVLEVEVKGQGKKLEKSIKDLFDKVVVAAAEYDAVFTYRNLEWTLAGMYRRGYAFETVATRVRNAPVPKQLKEYSEAWFAYKDIVAAEMERFENKAVSLYEETVKRSAQYKISTEWTRRAKERLNVYKPDEYPLLRDPALGLQVEDRR